MRGHGSGARARSRARRSQPAALAGRACGAAGQDGRCDRRPAAAGRWPGPARDPSIRVPGTSREAAREGAKGIPACCQDRAQAGRAEADAIAREPATAHRAAGAPGRRRCADPEPAGRRASAAERGHATRVRHRDLPAATGSTRAGRLDPHPAARHTNREIQPGRQATGPLQLEPDAARTQARSRRRRGGERPDRGYSDQPGIGTATFRPPESGRHQVASTVCRFHPPRRSDQAAGRRRTRGAPDKQPCSGTNRRRRANPRGQPLPRGFPTAGLLRARPIRTPSVDPAAARPDPDRAASAGGARRVEQIADGGRFQGHVVSCSGACQRDAAPYLGAVAAHEHPRDHRGPARHHGIA